MSIRFIESLLAFPAEDPLPHVTLNNSGMDCTAIVYLICVNNAGKVHSASMLPVTPIREAAQLLAA